MDPFSSYPRSPKAASQDAFLITPSDTADLPQPTYGGFWLGTAGAVKVTTSAGTTLILPSGQTYWNLVVTRVWATGTTAANMTGLI